MKIIDLNKDIVLLKIINFFIIKIKETIQYLILNYYLNILIY